VTRGVKHHLEKLRVSLVITSIKWVICCISTGVFGFPPNEASVLAVESVKDGLEKNEPHFNTVLFNVFTESD
jgi:O-acetyl-ADP-ribose deacetylase (regulator of RNase III)